MFTSPLLICSFSAEICNNIANKLAVVVFQFHSTFINFQLCLWLQPQAQTTVDGNAVKMKDNCSTKKTFPQCIRKMLYNISGRKICYGDHIIYLNVEKLPNMWLVAGQHKQMITKLLQPRATLTDNCMSIHHMLDLAVGHFVLVRVSPHVHKWKAGLASCSSIHLKIDQPLQLECWTPDLWIPLPFYSTVICRRVCIIKANLVRNGWHFRRRLCSNYFPEMSFLKGIPLTTLSWCHSASEVLP